LRLTQRSFAEKLGVEVGHVAFIESGRRRPSLKLVARIADSLGLDGQMFYSSPIPKQEPYFPQENLNHGKTPPVSWQRFIKNRALLTRYQVTKPELQVLEHVSLLGTAISAKEFLAILTLIRDIPEHK